MISFRRPNSTPSLLFALHAIMLTCQVTTLASERLWDGLAFGLAVAEICVTFSVLTAILMMPMRNPGLGPGNVCPPFKPPTYHLRSPEDSMTLWQFLTVAWMAPLIRMGRSRQLNDEDVWLLPYEFQHGRLHYLFRDIKGSVLIRLLKVNGLDLVITTLTGIIESAACRLICALEAGSDTDTFL